MLYTSDLRYTVHTLCIYFTCGRFGHLNGVTLRPGPGGSRLGVSAQTVISIIWNDASAPRRPLPVAISALFASGNTPRTWFFCAFKPKTVVIPVPSPSYRVRTTVYSPCSNQTWLLHFLRNIHLEVKKKEKKKNHFRRKNYLLYFYCFFRNQLLFRVPHFLGNLFYYFVHNACTYIRKHVNVRLQSKYHGVLIRFKIF